MDQHRPPWMPEGIFIIICLALFIPLMFAIKAWVAEPFADLMANSFGRWSIPLFFGSIAIVTAIGAYRNWRRGLLPYQRRRAEAWRERERL